MKLDLKITLLFAVVSTVVLTSCKKDKVLPSKFYIHVSHTRTEVDPVVDNTVSNINFDEYDMTWLGGDLVEFTTQNSTNMDALDQLFDFSAPSTLWSLGNHDYNNPSLVSSYTNRPTFYAYHQDGITYLVLDTQISDCSFTGAQKTMIQNVTDTIQSSSHLVLLHHKLVWMAGHPTLQSQIENVSNGDEGTCQWCLFPNNFNSEIYPMLVNTQNKGINVICVGGDVGMRTDQFEYKTADGIYFLASGLNYLSDDDKVLVFRHVVEQRMLYWEFKNLN